MADSVISATRHSFELITSLEPLAADATNEEKYNRQALTTKSRAYLGQAFAHLIGIDVASDITDQGKDHISMGNDQWSKCGDIAIEHIYTCSDFRYSSTRGLERC